MRQFDSKMGFFNLRRGDVRVFGLFASISGLILAAVSLVISIFGLVLASGACFKHFWARFSILGSVLSIFGLVLAVGACSSISGLILAYWDPF